MNVLSQLVRSSGNSSATSTMDPTNAVTATPAAAAADDDDDAVDALSKHQATREYRDMSHS